jgi:hypothetical protein
MLARSHPEGRLMCNCVFTWRKNESIPNVHSSRPVFCSEIIEELQNEVADLKKKLAASEDAFEELAQRM